MKYELNLINTAEENIQNVVLEVLSGNIEALDVYSTLESFKKFIERESAKIKEQAKDEANGYPENEFTHKGYLISKKTGSGKYNYKECSEWSNLKKQLTAREQLLKQASKGNAIIVDPETGEEIQPVSYTHYADSITIKKI